jgi:hypothetical protein
MSRKTKSLRWPASAKSIWASGSHSSRHKKKKKRKKEKKKKKKKKKKMRVMRVMSRKTKSLRWPASAKSIWASGSHLSRH